MSRTGVKAGDGPIFVGVNLHRRTWHVTIRTEAVEVLSTSIPGAWKVLQRLLERYPGGSIHVVYEAGYFGFWLHDRVIAFGAACTVTPPSRIIVE